MDRTKLIGASEVPAIFGFDSFCTPLKLWSLKTGALEPDDLSDNEACEWGCRLERVVSAKFAEKHDCKVIAYKRRYVHPTMPFFSCELDNIIAGTDELAEIKTVNAWAWKSWENSDELPEKVIMQVMTQLGLSGRKVGWIACLCGGQKYIEKRIEFDAEMWADIERNVAEFWQMVQDKVAPIAVSGDDDTLLALHPTTNEQIQDVQEMNDSVALLQQTKGSIKDLDATKKELEAKIKDVIKDNLGIKTSEYVVKWSPQVSRRVDTERLKADNLYEKYLKQSDTRVLRISKNKEEKIEKD